MFVGAERLAEVENLLARFDQARQTSSPTMITYVAPPGWGKTRIVQEFYRRLAAAQPEPHYWPPSLIHEAGTGAATFIDVTTSRKAVRHRVLTIPPGATLPWLWLAPPTGRLGDGSCAPALDQLVGQLARHLKALLASIEARGMVDDTLLGAIAAVMPLPDLAALTQPMPDLGRRLVDLHLARLSAAPADADPVADRGSAFAALLASLLRRMDHDCPGVVVVLDDAHDLDEATVNFVADILSGDLPVLFIATTWPDPPADEATPSPFTRYLAEAATAERIIRVHLALLASEDLVEYLLKQFPATDPLVATRLAGRADRNPYALRLLLDTTRVRAATENGRIQLDSDEIDQLNGGLDSLLREHWARLSAGVQQTLVTAAMLGQSFLDDVLLAALGALDSVGRDGGLHAALASAWIRPAGEPARIIEFIERIRYDLARDAAASVLSATVRDAVLRTALRTVRRLLADSGPDARQTLLALHVGLAKDGVETDLPSAACSARELADVARFQQRRPDAIGYLTLAIDWLETAAEPDYRLIVEYHHALAAVQIAEHSREDSEPTARRALAVAESHLAEDDELLIHAQIAMMRARLRRDDWPAYQSAVALLSLAESRIPPNPSAELIRDLWSAQRNAFSYAGNHVSARSRARDLVRHCEQHFGSHHMFTLDAMEELGYQAVRCRDVPESIEVRREILKRRIDNIPVSGLTPTAGAHHSLASALMRGDPSGLGEAEQQVAQALTIWSRAYGMDGDRPRRARLVRARIWQLQGLAAEERGDQADAERLLRNAAAETAIILELRAASGPASRAGALMRHGCSLVALRDPDGLKLLNQALRIREDTLRQDKSFFALQEVATHLAWGYRRLGLDHEADFVVRNYQIEPA